ncbi:hypothetical protein DENIS_3413 [Desulfonema ishimotonii]|uniref:Uncharacterized protein n=1 Tax=Desulfonema ishimotonii TaxID=45657 RepID=A0A401FZN7_9BACT|nr:hypothetical protein [Desulfonema ishimotonii]GBC62441.1 hypothetical protein DENIS_3413 [Desulfonema ishimotonii]
MKQLFFAAVALVAVMAVGLWTALPVSADAGFYATSDYTAEPDQPYDEATEETDALQDDTEIQPAGEEEVPADQEEEPADDENYEDVNDTDSQG